MKALLVGRGEPERGGIPTYLRTLMDGTLASVVDLEFLNLAEGAQAQGGQISASNISRTLRDVKRLSARASDVDVAHIHSALAPGATLVRAGALIAAARRRGAHVVLHAHGGLLVDWASSGSRRRLVRTMLARADIVVAVSTGLVQTLDRCGVRAPVVLLANSVDVHAFAPPDEPSERTVPRILFVGNLTERKGLLDLFDASRILDDRGVIHEVVVVGGRPDEGGEAEAKVREAVPPNVTLVGARRPADMPAAYKDADIFCLPSWWEAAPLSVLEAMASRLPVVATRVGEVPFMVRNGVDGILVEARQPAALADALHELLKDDERRAVVAASARARAVDQYSAERTTHDLVELYSRARSTPR